jgi:6-phosphofructokinase 1
MGAPDEVLESLPGKMRRIGIMTSGGDSPGMNGFVRAVARQAIASGCEAYAVHEGYDGLVAGGDQIRPLKWSDVRGWLSDGGTNIGSARCKAFYQRPGRLTAAKNMILNGIDALVVCGGDGSLTGADVFRYEWPGLLEELVSKNELTPEQVRPFQHLNIVGAVGSIDNDMALTDATIGCYSSLSTITSSIDSIDATAASHKRAFVVEVMGRGCGFLAIGAALSTEADYCFFPEKPPSENWEENMCKDIQRVGDYNGVWGVILIVYSGVNSEGGGLSLWWQRVLMTDR